VFTSDRDGDPKIYVMNADGSSPVRLTHASGRDAHPYFSRDGRRIIFQSPRANGEDSTASGAQISLFERFATEVTGRKRRGR
jgi:Tol biopolymer transport system component